ncbi:MAG: hypothetical protein HZB79_00315, partial [Deltaproteobacteria bacterium]|nr:hypothetical protein [Deltaproteobacteria bacterium]
MESSIEFIRHLNAALKGLSLYPAGHPSITRSISGAFKAVSSFFAAKDLPVPLARQTDKMIIGLVDGVFVMDENPLYDITESLHELLSAVKKLNIGTITIRKGVTEREIGGGLIKLLHSDKADIEMQGGFEAYLKALDVTHITVLEPRASEDKTGAEAAKKVYRNAIEVIKNAMDEVRLGRLPSSTAVKTVINEMVGQVLENKSAILGLSMIKSYDEYTFHHCVNVSILSLA